MPTYRWKPTYQGAKAIPPEVAASELARIHITGPLTAKRVVDAARPAAAPLHPELEWDDWLAAEAYRENQARHLIRAVEDVVIQQGPGQPAEVRPVYVHVPDRNPFKPGTYTEPALLVQQIDQYERALGESLRYLAGAERHFHFLRSLGTHLPESVQAQLSMAHEAFHFLRQALETLRTMPEDDVAAD